METVKTISDLAQLGSGIAIGFGAIGAGVGIGLAAKGMVEAVASENGARMQAMDSATSNAEELIGKLTLQYNRVRQSSITQELTEIIAGANAIS